MSQETASANNKIEVDSVRVYLTAQDEIVGKKTQNAWSIEFVGCSELSQKLLELKRDHGVDPKRWPLPIGTSHSDLLLREFIKKALGNWILPYAHEEICHCRKVNTEVVEQAIKAGAHSTEVVSRWTSASTACGTCRPDVQKMIDYFLQSL